MADRIVEVVADSFDDIFKDKKLRNDNSCSIGIEAEKADLSLKADKIRVLSKPPERKFYQLPAFWIFLTIALKVIFAGLTNFPKEPFKFTWPAGSITIGNKDDDTNGQVLAQYPNWQPKPPVDYSSEQIAIEMIHDQNLDTKEYTYRELEIYVNQMSDRSGLPDYVVVQLIINNFYAVQGLIFSKNRNYQQNIINTRWYQPNKNINDRKALEQMNEIERSNLKHLIKLREEIKKNR